MKKEVLFTLEVHLHIGLLVSEYIFKNKDLHSIHDFEEWLDKGVGAYKFLLSTDPLEIVYIPFHQIKLVKTIKQD